VSARLEAIDRDPSKIDLIINSHFHFDHVGGNALIPNATMLVQRCEWEAGMDPEMAARRGFNSRDFDLGHKLRLVDGEHDVFGDGSVVCLPTHGHTPGHQSLRLRLVAVRSCSPPTPVTSARPSASAGCPAMSMIVRRCSPRLTGWRRWNDAVLASFSATIPSRHLLGKLVNFKPLMGYAAEQGWDYATEQGWVEKLPGGQYRLTDAGFAAGS
jgi:hypothetical protein